MLKQFGSRNLPHQKNAGGTAMEKLTAAFEQFGSRNLPHQKDAAETASEKLTAAAAQIADEKQDGSLVEKVSEILGIVTEKKLDNEKIAEEKVTRFFFPFGV